ncbi:MAG: hypothetical protein K8R36_00215 [Planctomycetales bacterium]|nr:hypothetical protein [Planctomycetales bacterium]
MKFGSDALFAVLFVFVGSLAVMRYIAGDLVGAGVGAVASLVIAVLYLRAVFRGQPLGRVVLEGGLAVVIFLVVVAIVWLTRGG